MKRLEKFQLKLVIFLAIYFGTSHGENHGFCPSGFERYTHQDDVTCTYACNAEQDCSDGEICCVLESTSESQGSRCTECKQAVYVGGCYFETAHNDYYQNNQIFTPWYDGCAICQCLNGEVECYNTCDKPFAGREWIVPSITAAIALLISLVVSLCVCCCVKSNGRNRPVYYGPGPAQRPGNYATCRPHSEETAPLTNYQVA